MGETLGAFGSGLAYDPASDRYLALADRGPGDGSIDYRPRYHTLRVERDEAHPERLEVSVEASTLFLDVADHPFTGLAPDDSAAGVDQPRRKDGRACLDPEAIVLAPDGTLFVADEYGPFVYQFKRDGHLLRHLRPPAAYLPRNAAGALDFSEAEGLVSGRIPNRGFEGLAISADGATLTALLQSALLQDGGKEDGVTRLLVFDVKSGAPTHEFALPLETAAAANARLHLDGAARLKTPHLAGCELLAIPGSTRLLMIQRDNRGLDGTLHPETAANKSLWMLDPAPATDLLALPDQPFDQIAVATLPLTAEALRKLHIAPVGSVLYADLASMPWKQMAPDWAGLSEKWEGLALRPAPGGDGRNYTLLVASDNDFLTPTLHLEGGLERPFPKARQKVDTQFLLLDVAFP